MPAFTQKYTIVQFVKDIPDGYEYSMEDWPLHVTLADVFAIKGRWRDLFEDLKLSLNMQRAFFSKVAVKHLFGEDRSVKVKLLENTDELQNLHDKIIDTLEKYGVEFNSPQYIRTGFKPHSTDQLESSLEVGDIVEFGSITLVDMFPNKNPYQRRVLGTIRLL